MRKRDGRSGAMLRLLRRAATWLDDLFFPERLSCLSCGRGFGEDEVDGLCPRCAMALSRLESRQRELDARQSAPPYVDYVSAAFPYDAQARELILRLKFDRVRAAAVPLARTMALLPSGEEEIIVPMPTTRRRLRERGFNQSELIARHLAQEFGMPLIPALVRTDDQPAQSSLTGAQRQRNLVGRMTASHEVSGKRVLLVDDVCTTGASASEAARALREAGAIGVGLFCAARSERVER